MAKFPVVLIPEPAVEVNKLVPAIPLPGPRVPMLIVPAFKRAVPSCSVTGPLMEIEGLVLIPVSTVLPPLAARESEVSPMSQLLIVTLPEPLTALA